jgi:hypothetical protein
MVDDLEEFRLDRTELNLELIFGNDGNPSLKEDVMELGKRSLPLSLPIHDNRAMSTETQLDMEALLESVLAGHPLDPETSARVREQAEKITEEVRQRCGTVDVVQLVREVRSEL